jgi:hypothetical protein
MNPTMQEIIIEIIWSGFPQILCNYPLILWHRKVVSVTVKNKGHPELLWNY